MLNDDIEQPLKQFRPFKRSQISKSENVFNVPYTY